MQSSIAGEAPVLLPLSSPGGRPYWYVATDRMTAASAILCSKGGSPRREAGMPALDQEAYCSAALDGAPDDASRVREALLFSVAVLPSPVTPSTIMKLTGMLTGSSAAIKSPRHERHVEELVSFLGDPRCHPLVKAAVAHAYILAIQPFTVGNGRLARLVTNIVLLRSGYSFVLNASLSAAIARHSADYIQAVRSIFLPENAASLTAFVEYIMEMLVETYREALAAAEQNAAKQPSEQGLPEESQAEEKPASSDTEETIAVAGITLDALSDQVFCDRLAELASSWNMWNHNVASAVRGFLRDGILEFTYKDCLERTGWSIKEYRRAYSALRKREMVVNVTPVKSRNRNTAARFRFLLRSAESFARLESVCSNTDIPGLMPPSLFWNQIAKMENSSSDLARQGAAIIRDMISRGILEFTAWEWAANTHMSRNEFDHLRGMLLYRRLIINLNRVDKDRYVMSGRYRFALGDETTESSGTGAPRSVMDAAAFWKQVSAMDINRSMYIRRVAQAIRDFITAGKMEFTSIELLSHACLQRKSHFSQIQWLQSRGMICRVDNKPHASRPYHYRFTIVIKTPEDAVPPVIPQTPMGKCLYQMENSQSPTLRRGAVIVREMIREGMTGFTSDQWLRRSGMCIMEYDDIRYTMLHFGAMESTLKEGNRSPSHFCGYRFILQEDDMDL